MSWRAVEMQVALPRTQDAGRIQEQIQQRGQFMQDVLASAQLQSELLKRKTVTNLDKKKHLIDTKERKPNQTMKNSASFVREQQPNKISHPYLGSKIDFNG
ncbi:hypothetical protein SAMN04488134_101400 [Amphibacillus marinus]|uniref:Uncharacterized protein n=1 Tax=Amphibacillus marinus TaxID=872970 RepID=A0A1H8HNZ3_9BACI|nr:hypothetical protein [Amphibacillus marinus]SEN57794.1 hypothetical protein SAMN04488134_101400 [Amphibacillus marinus]